jgi:hypothetical protein
METLVQHYLYYKRDIARTTISRHLLINLIYALSKQEPQKPYTSNNINNNEVMYIYHYMAHSLLIYGLTYLVHTFKCWMPGNNLTTQT